MKVGTDSVILGSWCEIGAAKLVLDIGTGTGLLALMVAQKSDASITAIEIDRDGFEQAKENVSQSNFNSRITVVHSSIQDYTEKSSNKFDLIISNPPYFNSSLKSNNNQRNLARHTDSLSYDTLLDSAKKLLSKYGRLVIVVPFLQFKTLLNQALLKGFHLRKLCKVYSYDSDIEPIRALIELTIIAEEVTESELYIREKTSNKYHITYIKLTEAYYL